MIVPMIDGYSGAPVVFHHEFAAVPPAAMKLDSVDRLDHGVVWLRYSRLKAES